MNLTFSLSLEQRALTNIAITLWSQDDIRHLLTKSALYTLNGNWEEIEESVIEKSLKLQLPEMLKQKLLDFIVRVGLQIIVWLDFHYYEYCFVTELPSVFAWTSVGTINNIKTAKLLVMSGTLDNYACFALALMYCLEDEIKYCWNVLDIVEILLDLPLHTSKLNCASYWSDYMDKLNGLEFKMEKYSSNLSLLQLVLESTRNGNEAATKYFFQKVNKIDDNNFMIIAKFVASILDCFSSVRYNLIFERYSDVMIFLLSEMNTEQQTEMFASYAYAVLICFLVWPRRNLFMEIVKDKWDFLSKHNYNDLLHCIAEMVDNNSQLLEEFWQLSPETYKRFVIVRTNILLLAFNLYKSGNEKFFKLLLKYASISVRKRIIFEYKSIELFEYLVSAEKWNSIVFLIQECSTSLDELMVFRSTFRVYVTKLQDEYIKKYQWDKFFQILNCCIFRRKKKTIQKTVIHHISKKRLYKCIEE